MLKNQQKIDGYWYNFDVITGAMKTGFQYIKEQDKTVYYDKNGHMLYGMQNIDGSTYYFDKSTGAMKNNWAIVDGTKCYFGKNGELKAKNVKKVIDISKHNGNIDWPKVKKDGVDAVIIRAAYRGYGTGKLAEDINFYDNVRGASSQKIPIGIYVYSQAINVTEAIEEANKLIDMANESGGKSIINMPIVFDTEFSGCYENGKRCGRADFLSKNDRTTIAKAFQDKISKAGYTPMIYASTSFLHNDLVMSKLSNYKVWVAQYGAKVTYTGKYVMWQYTSSGSVAGISGNVDMNIMY